MRAGGAAWFTTEAALAWYVGQLSGEVESPATPPRSPAARSRASAAAAATLEKLGA